MIEDISKDDIVEWLIAAEDDDVIEILARVFGVGLNAAKCVTVDTEIKIADPRAFFEMVDIIRDENDESFHV